MCGCFKSITDVNFNFIPKHIIIPGFVLKKSCRPISIGISHQWWRLCELAIIRHYYSFFETRHLGKNTISFVSRRELVIQTCLVNLRRLDMHSSPPAAVLPKLNKQTSAKTGERDNRTGLAVSHKTETEIDRGEGNKIECLQQFVFLACEAAQAADVGRTGGRLGIYSLYFCTNTLAL